MVGYEPARDISVLHASDVTKDSFCPRRWALYDIFKMTPPGSVVGTALRATYDLGNATAKVLIEQWGGNSVVGHWYCRRCGGSKEMTSRPGNGCLKHHDCLWEYREVVFKSVQYGISGSLDVLFKLGAPKLFVTELKTYAADEFNKMVLPLSEHRIRTQLYLKIIADSDSPYKEMINLHEAKIVYVSRGYGKANPEHGGEVLPFREWTINRDDAALESEGILKKATQLKLWRDTGAMPKGICFSAGDKEAKKCQVCKHCFSGQFPGVQ
jgi:hypothetical protein